MNICGSTWLFIEFIPSENYMELFVQHLLLLFALKLPVDQKRYVRHTKNTAVRYIPANARTASHAILPFFCLTVALIYHNVEAFLIKNQNSTGQS